MVMDEGFAAPLANPSGTEAGIGPALSWSAIFAGAVSALGLALILTLFAAGFGYALAFPGFASRGSLAAFTPAIGALAIVIQVLCGAFSGYLAGRLRGAWTAVHLDEAHFRDTAHGLVAWALSTVAGVVLGALVITPYAEQLAGPASTAAAMMTAAAQPERAAHVAAQASFFLAMGMLLSAFVAAVAGRLGGLRAEAMHGLGR